jgi:hypothetical protein
MMGEGISLDHFLAEYEQQCATSNEIVAGRPLDAVGSHPDFGSAAANLRWMLIRFGSR